MKSLLSGISNANNHLLKEILIDDALNMCIAAIGQSQDIDRCYIFRNETEDQDLKLYYVYEWCNTGVDSYLGHPELNGASYDGFPGIYDTMIKDEPLFGLVKDNDNALFVETMEMQGIKSYLFTPIFSDNQFWGFIGFDDCKTEKKWIEEEVYALHTVAKNIGIRLNLDKTHTKLEAHVEQFDFYLKSSGQGMFEWDIKTNTTTYSYNWAGMLGYKLEEIDQTYEFWRANVHPLEIDRVETELRDYVDNKSTGYSGIVRMKHKKGHYVWIKYSGLLSRNGSGLPIKLVGSHIDVSEIKEKEVELELSEEKFRFLAENTTDLITQHYNDGTFSYVSNSAKEITGYDPKELIGKGPYHFIHPDNIDLIGFSQHGISDKLQNKPLTYRFRKKDGSYIWIESITKFIFNNNNSAVKFQSSARDISERIEAEEEMRLALLKEKELSELKSKFVSMASHQFRTPLTIIYSNAELIDLKSVANSTENKHSVQQNTSRIKDQVERLTELMNNILIFGKYDLDATKKDLKELHFNDFIDGIIETYFSNESDGRTIKVQVIGKQHDIVTDEALMTHIITNIINNAFKYSIDKPSPEIIISYQETKLKIEVIDYGIGIPKDEIQYLFTSFFRATNTSTIVGSGLGLTIVKQFTELLNGAVSIESKKDFGTKLTLYFPYE